MIHRSIGVSNFDLERLQKVVKIAKVKPAVNQVCSRKGRAQSE